MKDYLIFLLNKMLYPIFVAIIFGTCFLLVQINKITGIDPGIFYITVSFIFLGIFVGTFKEIDYRIIKISTPKYYNDAQFKTVIQVISGFIGTISFVGIGLAYDILVIILIAFIYWFILREIGIVIGYKIISAISLLYGMINKEHFGRYNNVTNNSAD